MSFRVDVVIMVRRPVILSFDGVDCGFVRFGVGQLLNMPSKGKASTRDHEPGEEFIVVDFLRELPLRVCVLVMPREALSSSYIFTMFWLDI